MKKILSIGVLFILLSLAACNAPWSAAQAGSNSDPNVGGGRAVVVGQMPTPAGTAIPIKQAVQPGGVVSTGSLTFTLEEVKTQGSLTEISYQLQGLPKNFAESTQISDPWIVLSSGEILLAREGEGGGSPVGSATQIQFESLPSSTRSFTLVIPNTWTGSPQTWYIPVRLP